ncbi:amidohydrolase/deacetylase family metallohydrolase [Bacillus sp. 1P06AnD]|uniref:amidohydrolase/deacetylase family metallohydrolase n=1 Tax=Bacillus sp. 1P06AnD TaxID=3132208 RepID=UPI0039A3CD49
MNKSIIISNGILIDPEKNTSIAGDIGIENGKIVKASTLAGRNPDYINAEGNYIAPGFIDMHVHIFENWTEFGLSADTIGVKQGVTTLVDAGSAGFAGYRQFRTEVIDKSKTEVLSFLNLSKKGLCEGYSELANMDDLMDVEEWLDILSREASIVGIKARMSGSVVKENGIKPLYHARRLADQTAVPIMVHIGNPPPALKEILPCLKKGDIVTHAFHGKPGGIMQEDGTMAVEAESALSRGVHFDLGHGEASFSYRTMERYLENYRTAFTISTDLHKRNREKPVGSLMDTMTKLLSFGFSVEEVVRRVTFLPAKALGLTEQGTMKEGTCADLTIFSVKEKEVFLHDAEGASRRMNKIIEPFMTIVKGEELIIHD